MPKELKKLIIKVLRESDHSLSPVEIYNHLILNDQIHHSIRGILEIQRIRKNCKGLVHDGILVEKERGKYAYDPKSERSETVIQLETPSSVEQTPLHLRNKIITGLKETRFLDLKLSVFLIIISILFILIPPFNQTFIRILIALPLLLFLPGYLLICVMFPGRDELSAIERFTLGIGLSIAIVVFDGFALNYTPWGFRPNSIVISISVIMGVLLIAAYFKRKKIGSDAYEFSFKDIESFYQSLKSRDNETGPEYDPALEKTLIITMIIAILLISAVVFYINITKEPEKFTAFYILGASGKAENFPSEIYINRPISILMGIENHEYKPVNYTIKVQFGGTILKEQEIIVKHEDKWLENVTFTPRMTSSITLAGNDTKQKLEFLLLKDNLIYRSVYLFVKPIFDYNDFGLNIILANGEMMKDEVWHFTSSSENITGNYSDRFWISPPYSYEINFTTHDPKGSGEFYQNIMADKESLANISFYVKDSYSNNTTNISKQVLIGNNVVWEAGVGNKTWENVQVPVFFSRNARISFRVYNKIPVNDTFQVWWDDIKIEPYFESALNKPITKTFSLNNSYGLDFNARGMPIALTGNVSIAGNNFPGFYYNIDENTSYERLNISFSNSSTIEAGNAVYISTKHGDEITFAGSNYKIINKNNAGFLSKVLLNNTEKTMNLNEIWNLDEGYSLYLRLISTKGDTAMLELRKERRTVESRLLSEGGIFEYRATLAKNTTTVFKARIASISLTSVKLKETELYSENQTLLEVGDSIGDFEIINISSSDITMKNQYPIKIKDGTMILGNNIRFKLVDDMAFPYALSGKFHGIPQSTLPGSSMNINGLNYPGFNFDLENMRSTEELSMYFSDNATVDIGKAIYRTDRHGNEIHFLGESYWLPYPNRINFVSRVTTATRTILKNGSVSLDNGYNLSLRSGQDGKIEIFIKRNMTESQKKLINNSKVSVFTRDFIYEMYTTTFKHGRIKSNIIYEVDDKFEYWIEYDEDSYFLFILGKVEAIDNNYVTMAIKQYQVPRELMPRMTFGEFEIESTSNGTILLKNFKPIRFEPGKEVPILEGAIIIRLSSKEPIAYSVGKTYDKR